MCMRACVSVCVSSTCTHTEVASISPQTSPTEAQGGGRHEEETEEENRTETGGARRSSSTATPSREDQLEAVFQACDAAGKGKVSAGRLADSLSSRLSELQPRWLLGELLDALCSGGEEVELDLATFRHLLFTWLHENAAHLIPNTTSPPSDTLLTNPDPSPTLTLQHQPTTHHHQSPPLQHQSVPPGDSGWEHFTTSSRPQHRSPPVQHQSLPPQDSTSEYSATHHHHQDHLQHHSTHLSVGPLNSHDPLEEWLKDSSQCAPPFLPPPTPPPRSQRGHGSLRNTFEHHLSDPSRRSTLLPRVGGWGAASDDPPFTPLEDMANPPSPISHPRPLFNGAAPPSSPPPRLSPDDGAGSRSMTGGRGEHHPTTPYRPPRRHQLNQSFQRSLNYTYGSIEDEGGVTAPDPGELQQEVLELSHTNKRLTGENQELTTHLTVAEETNANLREQCVTLRHALQGVQQQLESARALEAEVEAARRQVEEGREDREQLLSHLAHLERDNNSLSTRLHDLSEQLSAAQEELEGLTQREEEAVRRHRDEVTRLSSQLVHWKAQAETQTLTAYRLQETLEDVKKLVEGLREEKKSLEEQLNHVKEELAAATHSESDVSGMDAAEGRMALDSSLTEKSTDGSGLESSGVGVSPTTPAAFTTATTNASAAPTPLVTNLSQPSPSVNTPQSIHSEIQTMGEDSGSLPFCEKIEGGSKEERRSGSLSEAGDSPLASVLASMLRWWREWEERGIPLLRAMLDKDTVALHQHVASHYEELVRLERELQDIRRATQASPATSGVASMEEAMKDGSVGSAQDSALPSSQATTPTLPTRRSRTPGSHVSQLIYMFESSSQSSSPVLSEGSERPGSVEQPSSLSRMLMRARWQQRRSSDDGTRSESTNSDDVGSIDPTLRDSLENVRCEDSQNGHTEDTYDGRGPASGTELEVFSNELALDEAVGSEHMDKGRACVFLEYGLEPEEEEKQDEITTADIERTENDMQIHPSITPRNQEVEEQKEDVKVNGSTAVVDVSTLEPERDIFMETSHLMKLMNEVAEQRTIITDLRDQVTDFENERERVTASLQRLYRQIVELFHESRWTEGVRREWLAVVVPRVRGRVEEGEGAESLTPATPTHPLDEVPLTTSFSREEIEALISARRDPLPCDTRTTNEDPGHVSNPESLAAELEKELTALRVHVLRSHALLHHYQSSSSSSQYGSRAEVSTPALPPPPPVQGVEVGVECDLCGPTCVPRPCDSTATQTPASPLSTTPDLEEPPTTTLLTTSSARREEEVEEERREEEQEAAQQEEEGRKDKEDRARGRRPRTQQQQRVKWKEDLEEEEEDKEEEKDINEGATKEEDKLLVSVGGGAQDPPHPQQRPQQQPQRPPAPRQVGALDLPEHRQLRQVEVVPPAHRTLRQLGVGKEEEEEQQETGLGLEEGVEIIPMTSEHSLYSPKPAYDHLDHYRSGGQARGKGEEKLRRTGLSTVTPLMSSGAREAIPGPPRSRPRPQMELTPLSPPPSLDNVEEEDMEEEEEEEPALPSTPESSSSLASGDMFPHPPQSPRGPPRLPRQLSMSASDPPAAKSPTTLAPLPEAAPPPAQPTQNEETQKEGSTSEEVKKTRVFPSLHDTVIQMASLARGDPAFTPDTTLTPHADPDTHHSPHPHTQAGTPHPALEGVRVGVEAGDGGLVRPGGRGEGAESGKEAPPPSGTPPTTPSPVEAARGSRTPGSDNLPEEAPPGDISPPGSTPRRTPDTKFSRKRKRSAKTSPVKSSVSATIPEEAPGETESPPEAIKPAPQTEKSPPPKKSLQEARTVHEGSPGNRNLPQETHTPSGSSTRRKPPVRRSSLPEIDFSSASASPEKNSSPKDTQTSPGITSRLQPAPETTPTRDNSSSETKTSPVGSPGKSKLPEDTQISPGTPSCLKPATGTPPAQNGSSAESEASPSESRAKTKRSPERVKPRVTFSPDTKTPDNSPGDSPRKIRSFSELTDALGINGSPSPPTGASNSLVPWSSVSPEGMDVELPLPEQLSCLYDVVKAVKNSNENLSPQEIETKFTQLSLAFKTDRLTLRQRLDLQQRHRDTAEDNHEADMDCLRRLVLEIQAECTDSDLSDAISQVRRHLDVLATSSSRLVSISEVWGAVQQEWRLARAVEVIFRHVEDVKRKYETVKQELEELRGLLTEYKIELPVSNAMGNAGGGRNSIQGSSDSPSTSRRIRALSLIDCANKPGSEKEGRRPSMAQKSSSSNPFSRARSRRASLMADIRPFKEITLLGPVAAAAAATKESSSSSSTSSSSSGSSLPTRDRGEEGPGGGVQPPGRLNCVIAEEGSESGEEEGGASSQDAASPTTATTTATTTTTTYTPSTSTSNLAPLSLEDLSRLQAIAERGRLTDDSDEGSNDDHSQSEFSQGSSASYSEPAPASFPASLWNRLPSQHWLVVGTIQMLEWGSRLYALFSWLLVAIKEVLAWARGGQWPYSQQQTVLGARYACASLLLLAAAFLLLVTLSSGDASVPQPYHPGWTTMHHVLHPFVTLRYLEPPPT